MLSVLIHRQPGYALRRVHLNKPNADRFRSLAAFHHIDSDPLALYQFGNAGPVQRRDMDKNVFPPRSRTMKPNPLSGLYHFTVPISSTAA